MNSTAVIISAMLISPLMGPINGIGYSIAAQRARKRTHSQLAAEKARTENYQSVLRNRKIKNRKKASLKVLISE